MPDVLGSLRNMNRNQTISNPTNINTNPVIRSAGMFLMPQNQNEQLRINKPTIEEDQPEQDSTNFLGSLLAQGVASLGAGIQGGDIAQVGRSFEAGRQRAEQDRKAKALIDPKSEESKRRRMVFEKALGFSIPEEYSATDLNDPIVLQSIRDKKMQAMAPKGGIGIGGGVRQDKPEKEKKNPYQKEINEITIRSKNSLEALDQIEDIVSKYGTTEFAGPQGKILEQLVKSVAIDYNKVKDPNSVVRSEEAESVASSLGLGGVQGLLTSSGTALQQIKAFKDLIKKQKENALSIYRNPNAIELQSNEIDFNKE
jgi:hypothetical protein